VEELHSSIAHPLLQQGKVVNARSLSSGIHFHKNPESRSMGLGSQGLFSPSFWAPDSILRKRGMTTGWIGGAGGEKSGFMMEGLTL